MTPSEMPVVFSRDLLDTLMPPEKTDQFFEALFGDASEGAFDIRLDFKKGAANQLAFEFRLTSKPGKCLVCNLTYGLPNVFMRHPVINVNGIVKEIESRLDDRVEIDRWYCGETIERTADVHVIPLFVDLKTR